MEGLLVQKHHQVIRRVKLRKLQVPDNAFDKKRPLGPPTGGRRPRESLILVRILLLITPLKISELLRAGRSDCVLLNRVRETRFCSGESLSIR